MNIELLRNFLIAAETKNFTRAAQYLFVSQPTLSRQIRQLEDSIGAQLFIRGNKEVELTPAGILLYNKGRELLAHADRLSEEVRRAAEHENGKLGISMMNIVSEPLFKLFNAFNAKYPQIELFIDSQPSNVSPEILVENSKDIVVTFSFQVGQLSSNLGAFRLVRERFCFAVPINRYSKNKKSIKLGGLSGNECILVDPSLKLHFPQLFSRLVNFYGKRLKTDEGAGRDADSLESILRQIRTGESSALLPKPLAISNEVACTVMEIEDIDDEFDILLLYQKKGGNPAARLLIDFAQDFIS